MNTRNVVDEQVGLGGSRHSRRRRRRVRIVTTARCAHARLEHDAQELTRDLDERLARVREHQVVVGHAESDRIVREDDVEQAREERKRVSLRVVVVCQQLNETSTFNERK